MGLATSEQRALVARTGLAEPDPNDRRARAGLPAAPEGAPSSSSSAVISVSPCTRSTGRIATRPRAATAWKHGAATALYRGMVAGTFGPGDERRGDERILMTDALVAPHARESRLDPAERPP